MGCRLEEAPKYAVKKNTFRSFVIKIDLQKGLNALERRGRGTVDILAALKSS